MSLLPRLLGSASVVVALAAAASPAQAASTVTFPAGETPVTTVQIADPGPASPTVHLVVTAPDPTALAATHVYLGANAYPIPYSAIGADGVRDARYAMDADGELSTEDCLVYDGSDVVADTPVTVSGNSFSADLPKGDVISFDSTAVAVGIVGEDASCTNQGFHGLSIDYLGTNQEIDGFAWDAPAAPVVTATGGRRQVALSFDQERGTQYDVYRAGSDVPVAENIRGHGDDVQVVISEDEEGQSLAPGATYSFEVKATRLFYDRDDESYDPSSPRSAPATASTAPVQVVTFTAAPAASTTARSAQFAWTISGNDAAEAPYCLLDITEMSATEVPCAATGASLSDVAVGAHKLTVFPADGEAAYSREWTVTAAAAAAAPSAPVVPAVPATPAKADPDGDGIANTWLINGKAAPAPAAPKASSVAGAVKLKLGKP
ncbi:MAG TPA: hypothetical protein VFN44_08310, partial [Solirubrobacteraceae bacterium]|nr:hypothetical protein [Solirubrobacteraceae bacterium]